MQAGKFFERVAGYLALTAVVLITASCGGGDAPLSASPAPEAAARLAKNKENGHAITSALVPGPLSLLGASGTILALGPLADGGYTTVWCSGCVSSPLTTVQFDLVANRFDAGGASVGPEVRIPFEATPGERLLAGAGVLLDGSLMVAYSQTHTDPAADLVRDSLFTQRYESTGAPLGPPVEVTFREHKYFIDPTRVGFSQASFLSWRDGSYLVSWVRSLNETRNPIPVYETFARRFDRFGGAVEDARNLGLWTSGSGTRILSLTALSDGGYLVTRQLWFRPAPITVRFVPYDSPERTVSIPIDIEAGLPDGSSVIPLALGGYLLMSSAHYSQLLDNNGAVLAQPTIPEGAAFPLADGGFAVVWATTGTPAGSPSVLVQRYDMSGVPLGNPVAFGPEAVPVTIVGASLQDVGLALTFTSQGQLYTQLLREVDVSKQQRVRTCRAAAKQLVGAEHRQFMSRCLRAGGGG